MDDQMKTTPQLRIRAWCLASCLIAVALSAHVCQAQEEDNWLKHLRVGALVGLNMKTKFSMGGNFSVSGASPGTGGTGGSHTYDDGFVKPDQGTNPDFTSNWGYTSAGQYNSGTLTFHSTKAFSTANGTTEEKDVQVGLDIAYGGDLGRALGGWYGWELGFAFLPTSTKDNRDLSGNFLRTVHQFSTGNITIPEAPYSGSDSGVGPNIMNSALELPDDTTTGTITGSRTLQVYLYTLRLGPTMAWEIRPHFAVQLSGGPIVAYSDATYKFNETLKLADGSVSKNKGSFGESEFKFSGYVSALFMYHVVEGADIYIGAQYMPLGTIGVKGTGRKAELDTGSGIWLTAGINWPF